MSPQSNPQQNTVDATPTKEFFISMLVKDIGLIRAILDLVDNSVDGARRIRNDGNYNGLAIRIEADRTAFRIADTCGGIPVDLARNYAFRFGRPAAMPRTPHSVGQFGVGMKRALFKLGKKFRVESSTTSSNFVIEEDVDRWKAIPEWEFHFATVREGLANQPENRGTNILVTNLHENVSEEFANDNFLTRLKTELESAHQDIIEKGLIVTLNQLPLHFRSADLLQSETLRPAFKELSFQSPGTPPTSLTVKIYAGISESNPTAAGWYIFCNGRQVLEADQTQTTGWGEDSGTTIPKYHNQFARFRGYTFFDSDETTLLPWNTTKTGVDEDSKVYRAVRLEMIKLMRPVIDFLNQLDAEKGKEQADPTPLAQAVTAATATKVTTINIEGIFAPPRVEPVSELPRTGRISYTEPQEEIDRAKQILKVRTHKEVGEKTFDYFMEREGESNAEKLRED